MVMGTPRYMAPEQMIGEPIDARSDIFAAGAILFEMLAGRPAFNGRNIIEILHATMQEQPPALAGSPAVAAVDRVIRRALAKRPADRPPSAESWPRSCARCAAPGRRDDGDGARADAAGGAAVPRPAAGSGNRLPRLQPARRDRDLALRDRIADRRSSATAARFAGEAPDLKALAAEADVDRVVMGTLLRSGSKCAPPRSWSKRPAERCSPRTRCSRRSAICSVSRTISPAASSTRCRCRWWARRRPHPTNRTMPAPTSSTCAQTSRLDRTTGSSRRASCTSAASSWIRRSRRRGRGSGVATA